MLAAVKHGWMDRLTEKRWNARVGPVTSRSSLLRHTWFISQNRGEPALLFLVSENDDAFRVLYHIRHVIFFSVLIAFLCIHFQSR